MLGVGLDVELSSYGFLLGLRWTCWVEVGIVLSFRGFLADARGSFEIMGASKNQGA